MRLGAPERLSDAEEVVNLGQMKWGAEGLHGCLVSTFSEDNRGWLQPWTPG